ncbi:hypothetical protein OEZ60_05080 [Defluviimonas sp. WL0024]|uniref:DUF4239 domain-containing protein n=1 Tax=Albidovulum salinarum TaxID=2984153 RepID=A0ABT2X325_9RHOB|nr:hypothetical protein [Defluviimonas sp. WL0024]MCU9847372.1 hypothetical protein [Defluviimonas sp. WL0024]
MVILTVFLVTMNEFGRRVGNRQRTSEAAGDDTTGLVIGSVLGLLAFVLAFNLSAATSRNADRLASAMGEANAIGTAWLQAKAIGGADGEAVASALGDYLGARLIFAGSRRHDPAIDEADARTNELQTVIWDHVSTIVAERKDPAAASLMNAVNNTFDATTEMRFAMGFIMPPQLVWLLLGMNLVGMGAVGYKFGLAGRSNRLVAVSLSILWCVVTTEIIDLGSGRIWSFRTDVRTYIWALESIGQKPTDLPG